MALICLNFCILSQKTPFIDSKTMLLSIAQIVDLIKYFKVRSGNY